MSVSDDNDYDESEEDEFTRYRRIVDDPQHQFYRHRYPLHDSCEFESVQHLKNLLFVPVDQDDSEDEDDDSDEDDEDSPKRDADDGVVKASTWNSEQSKDKKETDDDNENASSSDENDSTAAAHAAAVGHSPQPIRVTAPLVADGDELIEAATLAATAALTIPVESLTLAGNQDTTAATPVASNVATKEAADAAAAATTISSSPPVIKTDPSLEKPLASTAEDVIMQDSQVEDEPNDTKDSVMDTTAAPALSPKTPAKESTTNGDTKAIAPDIADAAMETEPVSPTSTSLKPKAEAEASPQTPVKEQKYRVSPRISINERDYDENTALHVAILHRKLAQVKLLLEAGASLRMKCDGSGPLHTAISVGSLKKHQQFAYECVVSLHEAGADFLSKDESNHTPLFLACVFNLPQLVSYILNDDDGLSTLNLRADRGGNRPLHAAAKYDTLNNPSFSKAAAASATGLPAEDTTVTNPATPTNASAAPEAVLTQLLLNTADIEVDALNSVGYTPLHVACMRGNWPVVRLLIQSGASTTTADKRGYTAGQLCHKRGMAIPNDLANVLGGPPASGTIPLAPRDLIVDPHGSTALITHEMCILHRTCPPIRRNMSDPPPENVRRLEVLVDSNLGILRSGEFGSCVWRNEARRAAISDVLKCHEYSYVESISHMTASIPDHPNAISHLDPDTAVSRWSFEAAMRAAGSVCQAVDMVVTGDHRNAFCAVRPPGHHAGPRGIVKCTNDPEGGSHGFCLLNNVAIGAAYARCMYRNEGIKKVAIIDFDVHHGNGTEEIIRRLVPTTEKSLIRTPFAIGEFSASSYRPWLDETDIHNVFFASTHGYGNRGFDQVGWFYPGSGATHVSEALTHPSMIETPNLTDFLYSQTWARMGEDSKMNCCKIIDIGLGLPQPDIDVQGNSMKQRLDLRDTYRRKIFPYLREFDPDLIFISAGFDAHRKDTMNFGYVGMVEDDYEWVTEQLVKIANTCCQGRIVSVLEGGYKIHGGIVSPFARSVAAHVRGLVDGGQSRELYDPQDMEWEGQYERHLYERRERKKEEERQKLKAYQAIYRSGKAAIGDAAASSSGDNDDNNNNSSDDPTKAVAVEEAATKEEEEDDLPEDPDAPSRKRRRNQVDYRQLFKQMQQEGFGS